MRKIALLSFIAVSGMLAATFAQAAGEPEFKAAYAAAEAKNKEAGSLHNQWTTTSNALKDSKKAADAGKFDEAVDLAKHAEALASASIAQSNEQKNAWKDMVPH